MPRHDGSAGDAIAPTPDNSPIKFHLKTGGNTNDYGLDANGKRLWFLGAGADKNSLSEFVQKVKRICVFGGTWVDMKASDGQKIQLTLRPVIKGGHSTLVITEIGRTLPPNLSQSQIKEFIEQAKARYGSAWRDPYTSGKDRPTATVKIDISRGQILLLEMPYDYLGNQNALIEQPGCSAKPALD